MASSKYEKKWCVPAATYPRSYGWFFDMVFFLAKLIFFFAIAFVIVYYARKEWNEISWAAVIILTFIFFMIFTASRSSNINGSVPFAAYPLPPHLGLDGVPLDVHASY